MCIRGWGLGVCRSGFAGKAPSLASAALWAAQGLSPPRGPYRERRGGASPRTPTRNQRAGLPSRGGLHVNHVWTDDLMEDRTANGRKLRTLSVLDEYTRVSLAFRVERSTYSAPVVSTLEWL